MNTKTFYIIRISLIVALGGFLMGFYAPMIFEQSGIGTDASFLQVILVGIVNLVFTILAIAFIDKFGRKPLLVLGVSGIALCIFLLAYGFNSTTYTLSESSITFLIYGLFAALGLIFVIMVVPETKGKSLEELESLLIKEGY